MSVTTLASVTALLASAAAVIASGSSLIGKIWTRSAKVQINLLNSDPATSRIFFVAVNSGNQKGTVFGFSIRMSFSSKTRANTYVFTENLAIGPKKEAVLEVAPLGSVSEYLVPAAADERFNVKDSLLAMMQNLPTEDLKEQEKEFQRSFKDAVPTCEVFYQTQAQNASRPSPLLIGEIAQCREFMKQAYEL